MPAATVVPGLAVMVHPTVTSLVGVTPRFPRRMSVLPKRHSFPDEFGRDFSLRNKKLGLPPTWNVRGLAPSLMDVTRKGLRPFRG